MDAVVISVKPTAGGGYLLALIGRDKVLCHQDHCDFNVGEAQRGDVVRIGQIEDSPRGLKGRDISFGTRSGTFYEFQGTVMKVDFDRKFAFVTDNADAQDVFVHITDFADYNGDSATFDMLANGQRVSGWWRGTSRGRRGYKVSA
jgi:cold shock CspA family protein